MAKKSKLPADVNQKAKAIVDLLTRDVEDKEKDEMKAAAAALGRLGGLKGGKARAANLTAIKRTEIARKAANTRWNKK